MLNDIDLYCIIPYNKYFKPILTFINQTIAIYVSIYSSSYFRFILYNESFINRVLRLYDD